MPPQRAGSLPLPPPAGRRSPTLAACCSHPCDFETHHLPQAAAVSGTAATMSDPAVAAAAPAAAAPSSSEQGGSEAASTSAAARGSGGANDSGSVRVGEENKDSCVPKFDALWFCYCELPFEGRVCVRLLLCLPADALQRGEPASLLRLAVPCNCCVLLAWSCASQLARCCRRGLAFGSAAQTSA